MKPNFVFPSFNFEPPSLNGHESLKFTMYKDACTHQEDFKKDVSIRVFFSFPPMALVLVLG